VRIDDVDSHHEHARRCGARILHPPEDYPYGERQYNVEDLAGRRWCFSQSIADVTPEDWGGVSCDLRWCRGRPARVPGRTTCRALL
jgi:hypothetical protein